MKINLKPEVFYPGSVITTRFGWDKDTFPEEPRIHHAVDRAGGPGLVYLPFDAERLEFHEADAQGNSVLRAFADGGKLELRMLHFLPAELSPAIREALEARRGAPAGTLIGPIGNKGLYVPRGAAGTGRHVHYQLMLDPLAYSDYLDELAPAWKTDKTAEFKERYGLPFIVERSRRGVMWMSDLALCRADPWRNGLPRVILDSATVLDL